MAKYIGIEVEFKIAQRPNANTQHPRLSGDDRWPDSVTYKDIYVDWNGSLDTFHTCQAVASCNLPVSCHINHTELKDPLTATSEGDLVGEVYENGTYTACTVNLDDSEDPFRRAKPPCVRRTWNKELARESFPGQNHVTRSWYVKTEHIPVNGQQRPPTDHSWHGMEINSPIISDQKEIDDELPSLAKIFEALRNKLVISLTTNCGLHIHASPPSGSIDVQLAKRVIAVVRVLEEPFIRQICHPARRDEPYAKPIGRDSTFGKASRSDIRLTPSSVGSFIQTLDRFRSQLQNRSPDEPYAFRFMRLLFAARTIYDLQRDLGWTSESRTGRTSYGAPERCGIAINSLGTVELRYPQSSFDPEWVTLWVKFMQRIFQICAEPDESFSASFKRVYELGTRQQALGWESWLEELGLSQYRAVCDRHIRQANSTRKMEILPKADGV